jgi:hypothetical protein
LVNRLVDRLFFMEAKGGLIMYFVHLKVNENIINVLK